MLYIRLWFPYVPAYTGQHTYTCTFTSEHVYIHMEITDNNNVQADINLDISVKRESQLSNCFSDCPAMHFLND